VTCSPAETSSMSNEIQSTLFSVLLFRLRFASLFFLAARIKGGQHDWDVIWARVLPYFHKHKKMYAKRHLNYLYVYCLRHGVILQISIKPQLPSGSLKLQQSDSTEILSIFQLFSFPFLLNLSA
jgi:hypothetical protein